MSGFYSFFLVLMANLASLTSPELNLLSSLHAVHCQFISECFYDKLSLFVSLECSLLFIVRSRCWSAPLKNLIFHSLLLICTSSVPG